MRTSFTAVLPCLLASALFAQTAPRPAELTTEHQTNPIGIPNSQPRLSWKIHSSRPGEVQTAYEIRAWRGDARDTGVPAGAGGPVPALWSSGKVVSDQSVLVPWGAPPLASATPVAWTVRTWDKNDQPSEWSERATFETGLLVPAQEWKGQWITSDLPRFDILEEPLAKAKWISPGSLASQAIGARLALTLPENAKVLSASLDANADGLLSLYVNGTATRQGPSSHTAPFHADFGTQLTPGKNTIALGAIAVRNARGGGRNALAAHGTIDLDNGSRVEFNTDGSWKMAIGPAGNWYAKDFDDSPWSADKAVGPYDASKPVPSADSTVGPGRYLRKTFTIAKAVAKARLYSTALGTYEAFLNGKRVNDQQLSPGWTDYYKRVMVQTTDVTPLLAQGNNTLGALVTDGWFCGRVSWAGLAQYARLSQRSLFNGQLVVTYTDGTSETIATDDTWQSAAGETVGSDQQLGEVLDHRKGGWDQPADAWKPVIVDSRITTNLVPQVGPPVRTLMELPPQKITKFGNMFVVDFGQNFVGHIRLAARGAAGTRITVQHGEMLNPGNGPDAGTIYNENLRQAISLDTFVLGGGGQAETFEPRFTFHGFRYAQITGYPGDITPADIRGIVVGSDTPDTGSFECSDADVNRLFQNVRWGQRGNYISVPTDCPQRDERMGWMGDAQAFAPTAARNSDVAAFFTKWLQDVRDEQHADGQFNNVNPAANQTQSYPVWADAGVVIPWEMYLAYGDKAFLADNYDAMCKWVDYGARTYPDLLRSGGVGDHLAPAGGRAGPGRGRGAPGGVPGAGGGTPSALLNGQTLPPMLSSLSDAPFYIAAPGGAGGARAPGAARGGFGGAGGAGGAGRAGFGGGGANPTNIVDTAFFAHSAWILSQAAAILDKPDAARYDKLFHDIADAFNKAYVQPDGSITAGTQTCYVLALEFNLLPENLRDAAAKHLTDDVQQRRHLTTGFVGVGLINPMLSRLGRSDLAYTLLFQDTYPSWLYTVKQGATTMWERWDGYTPETGFQASSMNSFNHYSFGSIGTWFYTGIGGIQFDPAKPGYKHFFLKPQINGKLTYAKVSCNSPYGLIVSNWRRDNDQYVYDVTVPANASASLTLPVLTPKVTGDSVGPSTGSGATSMFTLPAGTYHFSFPASDVQ
ncbi:MAG TPA: family 78 glycoside hydrolase catalytic domain [Phycisphaerae bacterium]|nr:family 78 glycoside hydrolase catalytic domain [Phycisphaerae bacterium]